MQRILFSCLAVPCLAYLLIAAGLGGLGNEQRLRLEHQHARLDALAAAQQPAPLSIRAYSAGISKDLAEVALQVQVAARRHVPIERRIGGMKAGEGVVFPLMAPDAPAFETRIFGAAIIAPSEQEAFLEAIATEARQNGDTGRNGPVMTLRGLSDTPSLGPQARAALEAEGFVLSDNFAFVQPFLPNGREAALTVTASARLVPAVLVFLPAGFFALLGVIGLILRRLAKRRGANDGREEDPYAYDDRDDVAVHVVGAKTDFIQALSQRGLAQPSNAHRPQQSARQTTHNGGDADAAVAPPRGSVMPKLGLAVAVASAGLLYSFGGPAQVLALVSAAAPGNESHAVTTDNVVKGALAAAQLAPEKLEALSHQGASIATDGYDRLVEHVPYLKSEEFKTLRASAAEKFASLDQAVRHNANGVPLWGVAGLLGMVLLLLRSLFKLLPAKTGAGRRSDPYRRFHKQQKAGVARKG